MATFVLTLGSFGVVVLAMAIGAMLTGRQLKGSCGGTGGSACVCGPEKQAECKSKKVTPHAEVPIEPSSLARK